ncbi:hypothetical protein ACWTV9_10260 [Clostridioides difficile]|nr:hypothetical protein KW95_14005 [Clostridioides difficile]
MSSYNIIEGEEYKTSEIHEKIFGNELAKGGNQRKKQIENINAYLVTEKGSKKGYIKVIKILKNSTEIIEDKRINNTSHNIDTVIDLETIIMWLVNNQFDELKKDSILLSKNNALIMMGLVHENYKSTRNHIQDVAYDLDISLDYLNQFFMKNHNQIVKKLERSLRRLHSQRCINFRQCFIVCDNTHMEHRVATEEESDAILTVEGQVLSDMGLKHKGLVYVSGKWKKFKIRCEELLYKEGFDYINFYYEGYEIRATSESIKRAIDDLDYNVSRLNVNHKILTQCDNNTEKLMLDILNSFDREIDRLKNVVFGVPPHELIETFEKKKMMYMNINNHLVKGNIDEEIDKIISKYK